MGVALIQPALSRALASRSCDHGWRWSRWGAPPAARPCRRTMGERRRG